MTYISLLPSEVYLKDERKMLVCQNSGDLSDELSKGNIQHLEK